MTVEEYQLLEDLATRLEKMGVDDLRTVPTGDDPWALSAAIRTALAAVPPPAETGQREALLERLLRQGMCAHRFTRDDSCIYCGITRRWVGGKDETGYEAWEREAAAALASPAAPEMPDAAEMWRRTTTPIQPVAPERTEALEQRIADLEREHVSREDREAGFSEAYLSGLAHGWMDRYAPGPTRDQHRTDRETHRAEARRLLKLED